MRPLIDHLVNALLVKHPLPWRLEFDWTVEVHDASNKIVMKFPFIDPAQELIAHAERVHEYNEKGRVEVDALMKEYGIDE